MHWLKQAAIAAVGVCAVFAARAAAQDWKPAKGPLMTRWAKDVKPEMPLPEYPRPQLVRQDWLNLNGVWQMAMAKQDEQPPIGKALSDTILVPFPVESALSGVMKTADRLWYRRTFRVPDAWKGQNLLLHFGAVDFEAHVWLNGKKLGMHKGGYTPFSFDVTAALKPGEDQELIVGVMDPSDAGTQPRGKQVNKPGGIFYTPITGIWQTVWIEPVPAAHIESLKITTDIDGGQIHVLTNVTGQADQLKLQLTVLDGQKIVSEAEGLATEELRIPVPDAKLWSPDSPSLYNLKVTLSQNNTLVDTVGSYFGMRKIEVGPDGAGITRMLLNGSFVFEVGPLDQGYWPDGLYTAPTDEALKFDLEMTKKFGFNMTRKHAKVEPARWYYWCDVMGLLVWQDMVSGDRSIGDGAPDIERTPESVAQYESELKEMISAFHNYPSIVVWTVFNEGWGQFDTARITELAKSLDPTRLVNSASGWTDRGTGDLHDWHVYPGPGSPKPEPSRAAVLGEFGGLGLAVPGHTWTDTTWGYRGAANADDLTRRYENLMRKVYALKDNPGMSAAVYTQLTDVETEANGLLTYDREVIKVDLDRARAANLGKLPPPPDLVEVAETAPNKPLTWMYQTTPPAAGWYAPSFDDSSWKQGPSGFGTKGTPNTTVGTTWDTQDIWIRRSFTLPQVTPAKLLMMVYHDEDAEIYINGVLASELKGYNGAYEETSIAPAALATIKPGGVNTLAIHCHQTGGGQFIDVGIVEVREPQR